MTGKFIVFEGVDNSGKTTVSRIIDKWLNEEFGINTILTHHPGSTPVGQQLRKLLKHSKQPINPNAQALLFAADNSMFIHQVLSPSLKKNVWVLADRNNFISSLAYQIASGCSLKGLDKVHDATESNILIDLLFIFKCPYEESKRRRQQPDVHDRYEDTNREYFETLSNCYDNMLSYNYSRLIKFVKTTNESLNAYYIDATKPLQETVETIKQTIINHFHLK